MQGLGLVHGCKWSLIQTYKASSRPLFIHIHKDSSTARLNTAGILGMILEFETM